jgi:alpha-methylacyl-CoA racemase
VVCAILEARGSGTGQVVDAAMVDGSAVLMTLIYSLRGMGLWEDTRGRNLLDTGAPFYDTYETRDGKYVAIGPLEPKFYAELLERIGLADDPLPFQLDRDAWPALKARFARVFKEKTRAEWQAILEGTDCCFAPVLSLDEAPTHPHLAARGTFVEVDGALQPAPAPRFSRTAPDRPRPPSPPGRESRVILEAWGFTSEEVDALAASGVVSEG